MHVIVGNKTDTNSYENDFQNKENWNKELQFFRHAEVTKYWHKVIFFCFQKTKLVLSLWVLIKVVTLQFVFAKERFHEKKFLKIYASGTPK